MNRKKGRWGVGQGQITGPGSGSSSMPAARPLENPIAFALSPLSDPWYFQLRTDILRLEYTGLLSADICHILAGVGQRQIYIRAHDS